MTRSFAIPIVLLPILYISAVFGVYAQKKTFDRDQVRRSFKAAASEYLEFVKDDLAGLESEKRPGAYWLVHVRPKVEGHLAVKYTYKYNDPFYSEGENVISIRVGDKTCARQPRPETGIARFCLGDTVILPVRAANRYDYSFSVKYTEENDTIDVPLPITGVSENDSDVPNPLASNLKYLGVQRSEMLHRNGGSTVIYSASFQAISAGRFNLVLRTQPEKGNFLVVPTVADPSTPIIILKRGTPVTYIAGREDTINYADERKFSSHSSGTFPTNLLVLQPGDVFSLPFSTVTNSDDEIHFTVRKAAERPQPLPVIRKGSFHLDPRWGYNQFIGNFLP